MDTARAYFAKHYLMCQRFAGQGTELEWYYRSLAYRYGVYLRTGQIIGSIES